MIQNFNLLRVLKTLSKNQVLTATEEINLPYKIKILGKILQLILYPKVFFKNPSLRFGKRLTTCFEQLGPIYIKFGQTLSTRPDLVGIEIANNLKYLQDSLPPFANHFTHQIIDEAFGKSIAEIFSYFDFEPVAAASVSQVHKARLLTGELVAVKILRPQIYKKYNNDLKSLYSLARLIARLLPSLKRLKLIEVVNVFRDSMHLELNLRSEAAAASQMLDNFKMDPNIYIPKIYWPLVAQKVMVTEWVDGISIYDRQALLEQGLNPTQISKKIAIMFFNQAYRDGFFHADLHPGNILVRNDSTIALLDFGIVGILSEKDRLSIAEILAGFLNRNYQLIAKVHLRAGYIPKNTNLDLFAMACRSVNEPIIGLPSKEISVSKLLAQLFQITKDFGMETQPQLLLLQKTMMVVEGIGHILDPEINMWQLAEPWIKKWAVKNLSFEAKALRLVNKIVTILLEQHSK